MPKSKRPPGGYHSLGSAQRSGRRVGRTLERVWVPFCSGKHAIAPSHIAMGWSTGPAPLRAVLHLYFPPGEQIWTGIASPTQCRSSTETSGRGPPLSLLLTHRLTT